MAKQIKTRKTQETERQAELEQDLRLIRKRFARAFGAVARARDEVRLLENDAHEMGFGDFSANYGTLVDLLENLHSELDEVESYAKKAR